MFKFFLMIIYDTILPFGFTKKLHDYLLLLLIKKKTTDFISSNLTTYKKWDYF